MDLSPHNALEFKFNWLDDSGTGKKRHGGQGSYDGVTFRAGSFSAPIAELIVFRFIDSHFLLAFDNLGDESRSVYIEVFGTDVHQFGEILQAAYTANLARQQRDELSAKGELKRYRDQRCRFCNSTIVLTGLPETEQVFCTYCNTLFSTNPTEGNKDERYMRICEGCGMYSRPRQFSIFYFYFLFITTGFHHDTVIRCSGCMRTSAWRMVFGNLLFLLGFPFALLQLYRAYATAKLSGRFVGLDDANVLARRKKIDHALEKYDLIMEAVPENAGVKYNIAFGLLLTKEYDSAERMFEMAIDDCCNYWPAVNGLIRVLKIQGKTDRLQAVQRLWGQAKPEVAVGQITPPESSE